MNDLQQTKKDSILKSLAIAGFIGIIILIAWLSVKIVSVAPEAFSSLASLAESVNQQSPTKNPTDKLVTINVTSENKLVNSGDDTNLYWDTTKTPGSYTFSYICSDGIAIDILNITGIQSIACDTNYNVGNVSSLSIKTDSEKERYATVDYTVSFLATNDTTPRASGSASFTIINSDIRNLLGIDDSSDSEDAEEAPNEEAVAVEEEPVTTPVTAHTPTQTDPTYIQEYVYTIPTSDPNGRTDLATRFIDTGTIVGDTFFTGDIKQQESGAIQFEVKNYGTKTSADWSFSITLPNGNVFTEDNQKPLKPNERAVLTIGFITNDKSKHTFTVTVVDTNDKNNLNNSFIKTVQFFD